jgi:hypothetical protein
MVFKLKNTLQIGYFFVQVTCRHLYQASASEVKAKQWVALGRITKVYLL